MVVVEIHEEHGSERRPFNSDPHDAEVIRRNRKQHGENEQLKQRIKEAHAAEVSVIELDIHVSDCVNSNDRTNKGYDHNHERRKRISAKEVNRNLMLDTIELSNDFRA